MSNFKSFVDRISKYSFFHLLKCDGGYFILIILIATPPRRCRVMSTCTHILTKGFCFSVISEIKYLEELTIGNNKLLIAIIAAIVALILLAILTYVLYRVSEITTGQAKN